MYAECDRARFRIISCCQTSSFSYFDSIDFENEVNVGHVRGGSETPNRIAFRKLDFGFKLAEKERRQLPKCVEAKIRQCHPEESGLYMGIKAS